MAAEVSAVAAGTVYDRASRFCAVMGVAACTGTAVSPTDMPGATLVDTAVGAGATRARFGETARCCRATMATAATPAATPTPARGRHQARVRTPGASASTGM